MKKIRGLLCATVILTGSGALPAQDGLYFTSPTNTGRSATNGKGEMVSLAGKTDIKILKAEVYPQDNANSTFTVALTTSDYTVDPPSLALCVGNRAFIPNGWGSSQGHNNSLDFMVAGKDEAKAVAKSLSVECVLRSPPGYKYLARFIPAKTEFSIGEPVLVQLELKNLDDRPFAFQHGGQQRGARDNQYGFRAMFNSVKPVPDTGEPTNFGGLWNLATVDPGKSFEDKVDLKKWFAFAQPGTYYIHGFYSLAFYQPTKSGESSMPWTVMWVDYASADFQVVIK